MPSSQQLRHAQWQALHTTSTVSDKITVHNLQVIAKAGVDAWGRKKPQPALVTVALSLAGSFDSAAAADALDQSTVHYGQLSKRIKSAIDGSVDHVETRILAEQIIAPAIKETAGEHGNLKAFEIDIFYPKASMYGAGAGYSYSFFTSTQTEFAESKVLYLRDVRIPCIIGINPNERQQKQPVVVNLWIERVDRHRSNDYTKLETMLVQTISESSFETLESLSTMVVQELRRKFFTQEGDEYSYIRLRVQKPIAVPFADAPSIEILRPVDV